MVVPCWTFVSTVLSDILHLDIPQDTLFFFLLLDDSALQLIKKEPYWQPALQPKRLFLKLWMEPSTPATLFRDTVLLEGTTAELSGAKDKTIQSWTKITEMLLTSYFFFHIRGQVSWHLFVYSSWAP